MTLTQIFGLIVILGELILVFTKFPLPRKIAFVSYLLITLISIILCFKFNVYFAGYIVYSGILMSLFISLFTAKIPLIFQEKPMAGPLAVLYALILLLFVGAGVPGVIHSFSLKLFFYSLPLGIPFGYLAYYTFVPKENLTTAKINN